MSIHWFDHVEKLTRLIVKAELPRLTRILNSDDDPPPSPGPKTRLELDALILNVLGGIPITEEEQAAAIVLDKLMKTCDRHGLTGPNSPLYGLFDL